MIKIHLEKLMERYNLNISQLSQMTGISRKALTLLARYNESDPKPVSIQYHTIVTLCEFFKIGIDDLLTYEYSQSNFEITPIVHKVGNKKNLSLYLLLYQTKINNKKNFFYIPIIMNQQEYTQGEKVETEVPAAFWGEQKSNKTDKRVFFTPDRRKISIEVVPDEKMKNFLNYLNMTAIGQFLDENNIQKLSEVEVASLMKSFSKTFLAELTGRFISDFLDVKIPDAHIGVSWNFGYYSWMHSSEFKFEYDKQGSNLTSMDDDNLRDPFDDIVIRNDSILDTEFPNSANL